MVHNLVLKAQIGDDKVNKHLLTVICTKKFDTFVPKLCALYPKSRIKRIKKN